MNEQLLRTLYEKYKLSNVGTFEEFVADMQNPDVQKSFFEKYALSKTGSLEEFQSDLGARPQQPVSPKPQEAPVPSGTGVSAIRAETPEELKTQWPQQAQGGRSVEMQLSDFKNEVPEQGVPGSIVAASRIGKAQKLYNRALKEKEEQVLRRAKNYRDYRWKELSSGIKSKQDYDYAVEILNSETDSFIKNEASKAELELDPFRENYVREYNSDLHQLTIKNPALADGYYRTRGEEAFKDTDPSERSYWDDVFKTAQTGMKTAGPIGAVAGGMVGAIPGGAAFAEQLTGVVSDRLPGGAAALTASRIDTDYDEAIFQRTVPPSVRDEYVGSTGSDLGMFLQTDPTSWPSAYAQSEVKREKALKDLKLKAVENYKKDKAKSYMDTFGLDETQAMRKAEEDYNREKRDYESKQVKTKQNLIRQAQEQTGEFQGRTARFAPTWDESKGFLGVADYIGGAVGQTVGFAVPTIVATAATGGVAGSIVPTIIGAGSMMMAEGGGAYEAGLERLKEMYPGKTTGDILKQGLDKDLQDAALRTGITNGLLEYAGQLTAIGKLVPKNLITKFVEKAASVKGLQITVGSLFEGTTELVQGINTNYQNNLALGMSQQEAFNDAISKASKDEFLSGLLGGGVLSFASSAFEAKKIKANAIVSEISTNQPELDKQIDEEAEKAIIQTNAQTQQTRVSGGVQQGQAPVQEGTQPQGGTAEAPAGGVLQVSPETPGAGQAQVAAPTTFAQGFQRTAKVEEGTPQAQPEQGSTATLPPRVKGGQDRNFVFDNGAWKQQVGGDLLEIPGIQQEVNSAFTAQTGQPMAKPEPVEAVTPAAQSKFQKGQELFVVKDGQIMPVTYQSLSTSGKNASVQMSNGNRISVNPNDLFETEQAALDFMEAPPVEQPQVTPQVTAEEQTQEDPLVIESEKELEELFGPPVTTTAPEQQTAPEVTPEAEQVTPEVTPEQVTPEPTPEQTPVALEPLTKAEENKIKRYFWNKNPKSFTDLGTALSMTRDEWKGVARRLYKTATPEEKAMLEKLVGVDTFTTTTAPETTTQQTEQEGERVVTPLVDDQALLDNGYTAEQIKMIYDNPQTFGQIDNNIVNLETEELVKPAGKKKTTRPPRRRLKPAKKTYPKRSPEELKEALATNGKSIQDVLEIIAGIPDSPYADMATQLLEILPKTNKALETKFRNNQNPRYKRARSFHGMFYGNDDNDIFIYISEIERSVIRKAKKLNETDPKIIKQAQVEDIQRVTIHEIIHALTFYQLRTAIPIVGITNKPSIRHLNSYLNNGKDQNIKDIIKLYLSARDQFSALKKRINEGDKTVDERTALIYDESMNHGDIPYGTLNIEEFLTEAFSNPQFQRLLDTFESPLTKRKSVWQNFLDAVKRILRIRDYQGTGEYMRPRSGSILEDVLTVTPDVMLSETVNVKRGPKIAKASVFPTDSKVVSAVTKMAQGLINSGKATKENVIDKIKERIAGKFDIDVDAISEEVLGGVTEKPGRTTAPVTGKTDTQTLLDEFNQDVNRRSMGIGQESKAFARGAKAEKVADFLRDKITDREELDAFVDAWNQSLTPLPDTGKVNPDAYLKAADANRAWDLIKPAKTPKADKVFSIAEVIAAQMDAKVRGVRMTTKEFRQNLIKAVQDAAKQTPSLTKAQVNQMLNAVRRVNLFNPDTIARLRDKIQRLQSDAELAAKEAKARQLQRSIKDLTGRKSESALANYKNIGKGFVMVDPDNLKDNDIDKYIRIAETLEAGFNKATSPKYRAADLAEVQDYINDQINYQTEMLLREMQMSDESIKKAIVDGVSLEDLKKIIGELKTDELRKTMLERATELQEELQDNNDARLKTLRDANLEDLNLDELAFYVKVADNVLMNDDISSVARLSSKIKAYENTKQLQEDTKGMKKYRLLPEFFNQFSQLVRQIDQIFRDKNVSYGSFYNLTGLSEYNDATARKENRIVDTAKKIEDKIEAIDKKFKGGFFGRGPSLRSQEEIVKFGILSEFSKFVADPTEHISKVHENMKQTIEILKKKDEELGKKAEAIYNRFANVTSADEIIERFKKEEPHVHELWKFFQDEIFTEGFKQELMDNTMSVHGNIFVPFVNYMPTALSQVSDSISTEEDATKSVSLNPKPANTTKEAKRTMNGVQYYDLGNYLSRVMSSYADSVHDIETSAPLLLVSNMTKKSEFEDIVGGYNNKERIIQTIKGINRVEAGMGAERDIVAQVTNALTSGLQTVGSVSALGGIDQLALQYPAAAVSAMIQLGSDMGLFFSAPTGLGKNSAFKRTVGNILEGKGISVRGKQHKMDLSPRIFNLEAKNSIIGSLRKVTNVSVAAQKLILGPLMISDVSVAERAFVAFYLQSLKRDGFENVDLKNEHKLKDTPERRKALAYASAMVDDLMVSSTASGRSLFTQRKDAWAILRKLMFPFVSFPMNSKIRLVSAARKMTTNPIEGWKDMGSVIGEAATYNAIRIAALPLYYGFIEAAISELTGFEGEDEEKKNKLRKFYTAMINDLLMPNLGVPGQAMSRSAMNGLNYMLSETDAKTMKQFLDQKNEEDDAAVLEKMPDWYKFNKFYDMGQYGIGMDRIADFLEAYGNYTDDEIIVLNEGSEFEKVVSKRGDEYDWILFMNMMFQLSPYREFRTQGQKLTRSELKREIKRQRRFRYY